MEAELLYTGGGVSTEGGVSTAVLEGTVSGYFLKTHLSSDQNPGLDAWTALVLILEEVASYPSLRVLLESERFESVGNNSVLSSVFRVNPRMPML